MQAVRRWVARQLKPAANAEPARGGRILALVAFSFGLLLALFALLNRSWPTPWSESERVALRGLWLGSLSAAPADPTNQFANDARAARLGARLFRDTRLSASGRFSCASCHKPERSFTDGLAVAQGVGQGTRNTPSVVPVAYASAYYWDGRRDSQWSQALTPLENPAEMAGSRSRIVAVVTRHYAPAYQAIFGPLPKLAAERSSAPASPLGSPEARAAWTAIPTDEQDALNRAFANVGKALAAYQRTLRFEPSRFDRYVSQILRQNHLLASTLLSRDELAGLQLFLGRANCTLCHRGPLFTGHEFFSLALPFGTAGPDPGRAGAFEQLRKDPFNCAGRYSDAKPEQCSELRFLADDQLGFLANFKTPSLRNAAETAPYMHAGQFTALEQVIEHYSRAPSVPFPEHTDIQPLNLSRSEQLQLVTFLRTLSSPVHDPFASERPAD